MQHIKMRNTRECTAADLIKEGRGVRCCNCGGFDVSFFLPLNNDGECPERRELENLHSIIMVDVHEKGFENNIMKGGVL